MTKEQINKLEELFYQGINNSEIARQIGVERHTVGRYIKKNNLISPNTIQPGQLYGRLTIIESTNERDTCGRVKWLCRCKCGNLTKVDSSALRRGTTLSCGCLQKERVGQTWFKDLTGQRFGKLVVLKRAEENTSNGGVVWVCQCDCGTIKNIPGECLRSGASMSCGCMQSKGEYLIRQYLNQYNINFQTQYSFNDLVSQQNHPLRFDFAIFKNNKLYCLIEFQGPQHRDKNNQWHTPELEYNDNKKIQYCQQHGYNLLLINSINEIESIVKGIAIELND